MSGKPPPTFLFRPGFPPVKRALFAPISIDIPLTAFPSIQDAPPAVEAPVAVTAPVVEAVETPQKETVEVQESRDEEDMEIDSEAESDDSLSVRLQKFQAEETAAEERSKRVIDSRRLVCRRLKKSGLPPAKDYREEVEDSHRWERNGEDIEPGEVVLPSPVPRRRSRSRSPSHNEADKPVLVIPEEGVSIEQNKSAKAAERPYEVKALYDEKPKDDLFEVDSEDDMFAKTPEREQPGSTEDRTLHREKLDDLDDGEGYYLPQLGEMLIDSEGGRQYTVMEVLGKGVYSSVVRAVDAGTSNSYAIKIIRSNAVTLQSGLAELRTLQKLEELDPMHFKHTIASFGSFKHQNHLCVVFEYLHLNLREVTRKHGDQTGLSLSAVKSYGRQTMHALSLLKRAKILHCDIKPDNILATKDLRKVKLADFGSTIVCGENVQTDLLVARYYRAPEVVLGLPLDFGVDMWSVACTLYELYTGAVLFPGSTNGELLKLVMDVKGVIPRRVRNRGKFVDRYFDSLSFVYTVSEDAGERVVTVPITELKRTRSLRMMVEAKASEDEKAAVAGFADLLEKCLCVDSRERLSPEQAILHPFLCS